MIQEVQIIKKKFDVFYYFEEKNLLYIERHKGKDSHMFQLLWNYLTVHVHILQPSISTPSHMPWRNSCTCEPGDLYKNVYCIFIIEKKMEINQCPSTGKWLHSGIEYFTAVKKIERQLLMTSWVNFTNKTLREKSKQQKTTCRMIPFIQSSKTNLNKVSFRETHGKIKFIFKSGGMVKLNMRLGEVGG